MESKSNNVPIRTSTPEKCCNKGSEFSQDKNYPKFKKDLEKALVKLQMIGVEKPLTGFTSGNFAM